MQFSKNKIFFYFLSFLLSFGIMDLIKILAPGREFMDKTSLLIDIRSAYDQLTKLEKKVASYVLENPKDVVTSLPTTAAWAIPLYSTSAAL